MDVQHANWHSTCFWREQAWIRCCHLKLLTHFCKVKTKFKGKQFPLSQMYLGKIQGISENHTSKRAETYILIHKQMVQRITKPWSKTWPWKAVTLAAYWTEAIPRLNCWTRRNTADPIPKCLPGSSLTLALSIFGVHMWKEFWKFSCWSLTHTYPASLNMSNAINHILVLENCLEENRCFAF